MIWIWADSLFAQLIILRKQSPLISNAKLGQMQPIRECFIQIGGSQEAYQNTSKNMRRTDRSSAIIAGQSVARRQSEEED